SSVFLISDFRSTGFEPQLRLAASRHDLICARVIDPRERELPAVGAIEIEDAETGERLVIDSHSSKLRDRFAAFEQRTWKSMQDFLRRLNIDCFEVTTAAPVVHALEQMLRQRER